MAGVTDYPFRTLCKEQGAGAVYSEFVSAHGIIRENRRTLEMIRFTEFERPIGIQIFGDDPEVMAQAAQKIVKRFAPDLIDINYGCPVPKVTKRGAGSAALKDLGLMDEITSAVVAAVTPIPVSVKMRAGWDSHSIVIPEAGPRLEARGAKAITLHPRTTVQDYSGKADWSLIRELKSAVSIPVIGNGDVQSAEDYFEMVKATGCDGVMIGRAALGNPWIFAEIKAALEGDPTPIARTLAQRAKMAQRHLALLTEFRGEKIGSQLIRKHLGWYFKGFPGALALRKSLVTAPDLDTIEQILKSLQSNQEGIS
ncbi:MAG: tRNA dihydrouridine synthase DusB [FCB group bacterium]|nr:tRNA dihydrouridine synthase DusB [FCB group bacterium]